MEFIIAGVVLALFLFVGYKWNQARVRLYRENLIATYQFPDKLKSELQIKYPHLSTEQVALVITALRDYFHICNDANKHFVAMPSQVVDVAWHEFILFTREYEHFCNKALGRFLHHTPAEAMKGATQAQAGIKRAWKLACNRKNIDPLKPTTLPLLFAIDSSLNIADGFNYSLDCKLDKNFPYCAGHISCGATGCGGGGKAVSDSSVESGGDAGGSGCGGGCGGS